MLRSKRQLASALIILVFLVLTAANSWSQFAVTDALTSTADYSHAQQQVYTAMNWLKDNTPANATYLSLTDWRFTYTQLFFGRATDVQPIYVPREALAYESSKGIRYLIVTYFITTGLPPNPSLYPWNTVQPSSNFTLIYTNDDVKVFQLTF